MSEAETTTTPRVWIGCLQSYNAGRLIGEWVDATDLDEMLEAQEHVKALAISAAKEAGDWPVYFHEPEEFFLADNEGFGNAIGEYTPLDKVAELGAAIEEHGAAFLAYLGGFGRDDIPTDPAEMVTDFQDRYAGEWESDEDYARELVDAIGWKFEAGSAELDAISPYLDWEMIARELMMDAYEFNGHYFRANR